MVLGGLERLISKISSYSPEMVGTAAGALTFAVTRNADPDSLFMNLATGFVSFMVGRFVYQGLRDYKYKWLFERLPKTETLEKNIDELVEDYKKTEPKRSLLIRFKDWLLEHPKSTGAIATAAILNKNLAYDFFILPYKIYAKLPETGGIFSNLVGLYNDGKLDKAIGYYRAEIPCAIFFLSACYLLSKTGRPLFHSAFIKRTKHNVLGYYLSKRGKKQEAIEEFEKAADSIKTKKDYFVLANVILDAKGPDASLDILSKGLSCNIISLSPGSTYDYGDLITRYRALSRLKDSNRPWPSMRLSFLHYLLNDNGRAIEMQEEIKKRFPDDAQLRCFYALMLETMDKEKAQDKWRETLELIRRDPMLRNNMGIVDHSTHKVWEFDSPFLSNHFAIKEGDEDALQEEMKSTLFLKSQLGTETPYETVTPISTFADENGALYAMKRAKGIKLSDIKEKNIDYYVKAAEFLGLIHALMPKHLKNIDYMGGLDEGMKICPLIDDNRRRNILEALQNIEPDNFNRHPKVFIKDSHGGNIIIGDKKGKHDFSIIVLDFDQKGAAYGGFDTSKLIEQGRHFSNDAEGDRERYRVVDTYIRSFNDLEINKKSRIGSQEEYTLDHLKAAIIKSLSFYLFSYNMPGKEQQRADFIKNSIHCIDVIRESFKAEYGRASRHYELIRTELSGLPKTNMEIMQRLEHLVII